MITNRIPFTKLLLAVGLVAAVTSCKKSEDFFSTDDNEFARKTVVRIVDGDQELVQRARGVTPTVETFVLIDIRRDANDAADLNRPMTVRLMQDASIIADYNAAHGTNFVELPASAYTLDMDINNITFAPGEFVKQVKITLDKDQLNLSALYALAFKIVEVSPDGVISEDFRQVMYSIGVKNKYDGVYEITGTCVDANGLYMGDYGDPVYPRVYELSTAGPNQVLFYDLSWSYPNYIVLNIATGGAANTNIRPRYTFDLATDVLTGLVNANNGAVLNVLPGSRFIAADRSMIIGWNLGRWTVNENYQFLRDR